MIQKQKGYSLPTIVIMIAVLLIAVGGYYFGTIKNKPQSQVVTSSITPSPSSSDQTANWKTYTNTQYGVSFKYPSTWYFKDAAGIAPGTYLVAIAFFKNGTTSHISVGEGDDNGNELLYLYISNPEDNGPITETKEQFIQGVTTLNQKNITIDGHPAGYDSNSSKSYSIWYNDKIQISVSSWNNNVEAKNNIDTIISTFKFTDQSQSANNTPETVTNNFYQWYLSCLNQRSQKTPQEYCPYSTDGVLTSGLITQIKNKKGADPILCAQNIPVSIKVDKSSINGNTATVNVHTYYEASGDNPLKITLNLNTQGWQINNIECSN